MRFFTLLDLQHLVLGLSLGCAAAVLVYLIFRYVPPPEEEPWPGPGTEGLAGGRDEGKPAARIPAVLLLVYAGFVVWVIAYVIVVGVKGGPV